MCAEVVNDEVLVDVANGIMVVTMNRPQVKNAMNRGLAKGIRAAMDRLDSDPGIRVGILTGAGGSFCSGMDLKAFVQRESPVLTGPGQGGFGGLVEAPPRKPLIAAVEGYALAGGCEMLLACDLIVAASDAEIGLPEVKRCLVAGAGGTLRLQRQIPHRVAMEMVLTAEPITGVRGYEVGLVNAVVEPGTALEAAKKMADLIADAAPIAVEVSKKIMIESREWSDYEMFSRCDDLSREVYRSDDAIEGAQAFSEKRDPAWKKR